MLLCVPAVLLPHCVRLRSEGIGSHKTIREDLLVSYLNERTPAHRRLPMRSVSRPGPLSYVLRSPLYHNATVQDNQNAPFSTLVNLLPRLLQPEWSLIVARSRSCAIWSDQHESRSTALLFLSIPGIFFPQRQPQAFFDLILQLACASSKRLTSRWPPGKRSTCLPLSPYGGANTAENHRTKWSR